jgi:tetratricopeptide (TPR) repeat protein
VRNRFFEGKPSFFLILVSLLSVFSLHLQATPNRSSESDYVAALLEEYRHDPQLALKEYGLALKQDPQSAFLANAGTSAALEAGNLAQARAWAEKAISISSSSAESYRLLGRVLWAQNDLPQAEAAFQKALEIDPMSSDAVYALAALTSLRSLSEAKKILKRYAVVDPDQASDTYFQIADIEFKENHLHRAIKYLKQSILADPDSDSVASRYALAQAYEQEYSTTAAINEYKKIIPFEPRNAKLLDHIAEIYSLAGNWPEARNFFNRALTIDIHDPEANYWMSVHAEKKKDFLSAIHYLEASSALAHDLYLNLELSYDYTRINDTKGAVAVLEKARKTWPKDGTLFFSLALGLEDLKDYKNEIEVLRAGLKANPHDKDMLYELGSVLDKTNDVSGSEKAFKTLIKESPDDADAFNYLGYELAERGLKLPEAEALIKKAVSLNPANGAYQDSLGWVYYREGYFHRALSQTFSALEKSPEDADIWAHLSAIEKALKKRRKAWVALKMSMTLSSHGNQAEKKLKQMNKKLSKWETGDYFSSYLSLLQDDITEFSSACQLKLKIFGHQVSFPASCSFRAPSDISIEVMGPMFSSLFDMEISSGSFSMGRISIRGVSPSNARRASRQALAMIADYFSGNIFSDSPVEYVKRFGHRSLKGKNWVLSLDGKGAAVSELKSSLYPHQSLTLSKFQDLAGHLFPSSLEVRGKGFVFDIDFSNSDVHFNSSFPNNFNP